VVVGSCAQSALGSKGVNTLLTHLDILAHVK
jgi:hypothetical protein